MKKSEVRRVRIIKRVWKAVKNERDTLTPQPVYPLSGVRRVRKAPFKGKEGKKKRKDTPLP